MRPDNLSDPWQAEKDRRKATRQELINRIIRCARDWREWNRNRPSTFHVTTMRLVEAAEELAQHESRRVSPPPAVVREGEGQEGAG